MIETREQYATLLDDVRDLGYASLGSTDAEAIIETIEALRRVARADHEIPKWKHVQSAGHAHADRFSAGCTRCLWEERREDSLAHIEQHAPWLLEDE